MDFERDIQPILAEHCHQCHGAKKHKGGLRLDTAEGALHGGDSGPALVKGDSAASLLIQKVAAEDELEVMPPDGEGERLTAKQIGLLRAWIDGGAVWPQVADASTKPASEHWAYQPIRRPDVPKVKQADWVRNPIDAFVLSKLEERGIAPSPQADRHTLIKRVYYDLIGLPPTPEQVDAFVRDSSPDAYEKVVDGLLASKHFGERWGRHWLDVARYADSDGYEKDNPRPNAWRYRDWVIEAINADMPFDRFTIEQLAGDLLPDAGPMQVLATAFHRQTLTNTEGGTDQEQFRVEAVFDRTETTGSAWLGLTLTCARCHSHKYDQITQREYYQLFSLFNNGDEATRQVTISDQAAAEYERAKADHEAKLAEAQGRLDEAKAALRPRLEAWAQQQRSALAQVVPVEHHAIEVTAATAEHGVTLRRLDDGSYLAEGPNPDTNTYRLTARIAQPNVTGFRVEALAHKSLPAKGPGRVAHGNFVLNRFIVTVGGAGEGDAAGGRSIEFADAKADFEQGGFPATGALKDEPKSGWAVAPKFGVNHEATFITAKPLTIAADQPVTIVLDQQHGTQHTLGRFRITAVTGTVNGPKLPEAVVKALNVAPDQRTEADRAALLDHFATIDESTKGHVAALSKLRAEAPKPPVMDVHVIVQRTKDPRTTRVFRRGEFLEPQGEVEPGVPAILPPLKSRHTEGMADRLDLARWLMDEANPLTGRVVANQMWAELFGRGIVGTLNDFGVRGEPPTHPRLLDWLATEYRRLGFSRKAMIKTIVTSATYRQSSRHRPELADIDPSNRLLYRQNRLRVEAEIVRDLSLSVGGLLSSKVGGPSVFPPLPPGIAALSYADNFKWADSKGEDRYRRGMYTFFKRTSPHPNLIAFDCPDSNVTCIERRTSNTPLQALTTLNNAVFVEASQGLARRIMTQRGGEDDARRLTWAFRLCVARPPSQAELSGFMQLLGEARAYYAGQAEEAKAMIGPHLPEGAEPAEPAAWVVVARIMLNLDEFITRE